MKMYHLKKNSNLRINLREINRFNIEVKKIIPQKLSINVLFCTFKTTNIAFSKFINLISMKYFFSDFILNIKLKNRIRYSKLLSVNIYFFKIN